MQLQYLKTVGVQGHHPGPQGGHTVTGETRAEEEVLGSPHTRALSSPAPCHSSCSLRLSTAGVTMFQVSLQQRDLNAITHRLCDLLTLSKPRVPSAQLLSKRN